MLLSYKVIIVVLPIAFAIASTTFWLTRWGIIVWNKSLFGIPMLKNRKDWIDSPLSAYDRPEAGYPVITVRTLAVNALGIPTVFFLGSLAAMQFIRRPELYS